MKLRRTRWYNSLSLRLLVLFWALLLVTASSGFLLAIWNTEQVRPQPLAAEINQILKPLLSDNSTFGSLQTGRLVTGDYRVVAKLASRGKQRLNIAPDLSERYTPLVLRMLDANSPQQMPISDRLLVGPYVLGGDRLLLARPLRTEELIDRREAESKQREARTTTLIIGSGFLALLLGWWLIRPIKRLIRATREVAQGSAEPKLGRLPKRSDEVGELARALVTTAVDLATSRDAQRRLLSDVSHELRSPLARMQVAMDLLEPEDGGSNVHWQQLTRDVHRLGTIIDRILSLSRLENGLVNMQSEAVDSGELVAKLISDLCYADPSCSDRLKQVGEQWPTLQSDPELVRLILENLVRNALHYTDGLITLSCDIDGERCQLLVRDRGPGVPDDKIEQLFEPFYRGDPARHHQAGVGLGLALSQRAAGVMKGSVSARNHPQGGLEVIVDLPLKCA
ncbi:sensor histidine kinase [Idiomarina xiamenensis]|uniref:histidine kinase n=1 Tax=Idiomarina xiamenensis 10-D-4 TaxID=740709 RepID=K2JZP2_9GAMM|nr:HAMP domain-containing sensor histidine kinase [Idiomarina xiamenensis]EKE80923.1 signal transduction histidine kinase [Idiomarina xiamenensis 10-D-4]